MKWLPSFTKLSLCFIAGLALQFGGSIGAIEASTYALRSFFATLGLLGLGLLVVSPLLMGLKFFARLDQKG